MLAPSVIQAQSIGNQIDVAIQYTGLPLFDHLSLGLDQLNITHLHKFINVSATELPLNLAGVQ
jgi:hypothetical protein